MKTIREFDPQNPGATLMRDIHPRAETPSGERGALIDFRASDESVDRYREVILANGWQLDNYRKNPVVQNAHNYGSVIDTIGRTIEVEVRSGNYSPYLFMRVEFAVNANPLAKIAYDLYRGKFLNAVSVGFVPLEWETGHRPDLPARTFTKSELLEISAVGIPANANALQMAFEAGALDKTALRESAALLRTLCDRPHSNGDFDSLLYSLRSLLGR